MVDAAVEALSIEGGGRRRFALRNAMRRKSTIAFLMTLPLILLVALLVLYPALYSIHLATLNKSMERFVGFGNFLFLFKRETFWMVVRQSCIFAITAVIFKALIGFIVAHFVHNIPSRGQRKWRGMLLVPWVIPPAMSCLAWLWLFDPSYSAFNWLLGKLGVDPVPWIGDADWALFSVIVTFANFDIVRIITAGGPIDRTHVFATWSFWVGIQGNDIPLGASVSLFMVPILTVAAVFILRDIHRRASEMSCPPHPPPPPPARAPAARPTVA